MKYLPLTNSALQVIVGNEDYDLAKDTNWFLITNRRRTRPIQYVVSTNHPQIYLHRLILKAIKGEVCDHKNGDTLDNRRSNLRKCTQGQNALNRSKNTNNSSGFVGVRKEGNSWVSRIQFKGKKIYLGSFELKEVAARSYDTAARKYFGEFARLNFPI